MKMKVSSGRTSCGTKFVIYRLPRLGLLGMEMGNLMALTRARRELQISVMILASLVMTHRTPTPACLQMYDMC